MRRAEEAIVLVGGLGTRLRSEVADLPKPLAPVAGRPFLAYVLDQFARAGLRRIVLATGYLAGRVESTIGRSWQGMAVDYSVEDAPLGTGGAVSLAARKLHGARVHVANGDSFLRFDANALDDIVSRTSTALGMALAWVPDVGRYGAVDVADDRVVGFREKGGSGAGWINAGSYLLTPEALAGFPARDAFSFEESVLLPLSSAGRVGALCESRDFIDIGVPEDYRRAQDLFAVAR